MTARMFAAALALVAASLLGCASPRRTNYRIVERLSVVGLGPDVTRIRVRLPLPHFDPKQRYTGAHVDEDWNLEGETWVDGNRLIELSAPASEKGPLDVELRFDLTRFRGDPPDDVEGAWPHGFDYSKRYSTYLGSPVVEATTSEEEPGSSKPPYRVAESVVQDYFREVHRQAVAYGKEPGRFERELVVRLRTQRIPARIVLGSLLERDSATAETVRWVEFRAPGVGWIPIDTHGALVELSVEQEAGDERLQSIAHSTLAHLPADRVTWALEPEPRPPSAADPLTSLGSVELLRKGDGDSGWTRLEAGWSITVEHSERR